MKRSGFTLLEVLLALALTTVILGLLSMAIDVHLRVADTSRNAVEESQSARFLLRQMADDLHRTIPVTQAPSSIGCLRGNREELQVDVSRLPLLDETQTATPLSDVRTITYFVAKPDAMRLPETSDLHEQNHGLLRREWERATFAWATQNGHTDNLNRALKVLSPEVEAIEFSYLDGGTAYQEWDSDEQGKLPAAIKIAVSIRQPWRKPQRTFAEEMTEKCPTTTYSLIIDLPNASATLNSAIVMMDKAIAETAEQLASASQETKEAKSSNSTEENGDAENTKVITSSGSNSGDSDQ